MKYAVLAVLFTIMQTFVPVPWKTADSRTGETRKSPDKRDAPQQPAEHTMTAPTKSSSWPTQQRKEANGKENIQTAVAVREFPSVSVRRDWVDIVALALTFGLVIVGSLGVCAAYRTLRNIEAQTEHILRSSKAAESAASTAEKNIQLVIDKERARIRVEVDKPWLEVGTDHVPEYPEVRYKVEMYGLTPAFIEDEEATAYTADIADASPPNPTNVPMGLPPVIKPDTPPISNTCFIFPKMKLGQTDVDNIRNGVSFLNFRGVIRYKDVFGNDHSTTFKYRWAAEKHADGTPYGYWVKCGTAEDNRQT